MFRRFLVLLSLTLVFVYPSLAVGPTVVPLAVLLLIAAVDRFFQIDRVVAYFSWSTLLIAALVIAIGAFQSLYWQSLGILIATLQLVASVLLALWIANNWSRAFGFLDRRSLFQKIARVIVIVLALAGVEAFFGLSFVYNFTDGFLHDGIDVASNIEREVAIAGFVRPRLFTSEPSHLAKNLLVMTTCALLCAYSQRTILHVAVLIVISLIVVRSPILAGGIVLVGARLMLARGIGVGRLAVAVLVLVVTIFGTANLLGNRLDLLRAGDDLSTFLRLEVPLRLAGDAVVASPFFGVGPGNDEFVRTRTATYQATRGLDTQRAAGLQINNGFATLLISFGLLGGAAFIVFVVAILRKICGKIPIIYALFLGMLPFALGAIFAPRFWIYATLPAALIGCVGTTDDGIDK